MKKIILLIFLATVLPSFTITHSTFTIVGSWKATDKGKTIFMIFDREGYALMGSEGKMLGGKSFDINGEKGTMSYKADLSKNPGTLDITITRLSNKAQKKLLGIIKVVNDNEIRINLAGDIRPVTFDGPQTVTFTRVVM